MQIVTGFINYVENFGPFQHAKGNFLQQLGAENGVITAKGQQGDQSGQSSPQEKLKPKLWQLLCNWEKMGSVRNITLQEDSIRLGVVLGFDGLSLSRHEYFELSII